MGSAGQVRWRSAKFMQPTIIAAMGMSWRKKKIETIKQIERPTAVVAQQIPASTETEKPMGFWEGGWSSDISRTRVLKEEDCPGGEEAASRARLVEEPDPMEVSEAVEEVRPFFRARRAARRAALASVGVRIGAGGGGGGEEVGSKVRRSSRVRMSKEVAEAECGWAEEPEGGWDFWDMRNF